MPDKQAFAITGKVDGKYEVHFQEGAGRIVDEATLSQIRKEYREVSTNELWQIREPIVLAGGPADVDSNKRLADLEKRVKTLEEALK